MTHTADNEKSLCALCKQPVEIIGFSLITREGQKNFCCAGCLSIYQLLHDIKSHSPDLPS
ncbi:MAG: hypothetical protein RL637_1632 [Pseudomonadota bacterium]|jgi:hypothetical protein